MGFAGIIDTEGSLYLSDNGTYVPMETLTREELGKRIWYVSPDKGLNRLRIVDVYQNSNIEDYLARLRKEPDKLTDFERLMLTLPDVALERQLFALARDMKKDKKYADKNFYGFDEPEGKEVAIEGLLSVFPQTMFDEIYMFRHLRNQKVADYLREKGGNFTEIKPDQTVGSLSQGMRMRFLWEYNMELYKMNEEEGKTRVIVLDEPIGNLDRDNAISYCQNIKEISEKDNAPVFILISHAHEDIIEQELGYKIKEVSFGPQES